ncbi:DUF2332 domain-containing protein [Microbacterium album]|uniref:DUF2332 domain-containing protein n=1 Tax=Microbacterium album TaxID=2053191 RepID=A0A917IF57_9MICO|nr:DUF2332 domain-containing protein [Microbacterium album]GGH43782.1 hypothetical protein GCM10010921_18000 [Microbacterium album]
MTQSPDSAEAEAVAERFARFAREEAPGRSAVYAEWATGVAADPELCGILARIPAQRRQPPLVFAVTRMLGAPVEPAGAGSFAAWAAFVRANAARVVAECSARTLQTNEPLRCAALLPALARIPGPLALLELGASGGLCLYPDRYAYRYGRTGLELGPRGGAAVTLETEVRGAEPLELPDALPRIVWRGGIDLQPLDARDAGDRAWLEGLVWPEERDRAERISAALDVVAADPPLLVAGDASDVALVRRVAARAPVDATLVVTTPGVLPYVPRARREALIAALRDPAGVRAPLPGQHRGAHWITLDQPGLHDAWSPPIDAAAWPGFALALDGEVLAAADPLGAWIEPRRAGH